jgi:catechol 2,3-dioxygenase-like lactoylglutathione lyase family enzyme
VSGDASSAGNPALVGLGARVHVFVRPEDRAAFSTLFRDVLGCAVVERDFGMAYPVLFVGFGDGSGFSVEFSGLAPLPPAGPIDDATAARGAWIELRTADLAGCQQRLRDAGIPEFRHPGSSHVYFSAPGGQVFRILDAAFVGP